MVANCYDPYMGINCFRQHNQHIVLYPTVLYSEHSPRYDQCFLNTYTNIPPQIFLYIKDGRQVGTIEVQLSYQYPTTLY